MTQPQSFLNGTARVSGETPKELSKVFAHHLIMLAEQNICLRHLPNSYYSETSGMKGTSRPNQQVEPTEEAGQQSHHDARVEYHRDKSCARLRLHILMPTKKIVDGCCVAGLVVDL